MFLMQGSLIKNHWSSNTWGGELLQAGNLLKQNKSYSESATTELPDWSKYDAQEEEEEHSLIFEDEISW